jgi:hypothetical protein
MNAERMEDRQERWTDRLRTLGRQMTARPFPSILTAVAIGFLAGLVLRLLETPRREK